MGFLGSLEVDLAVIGLDETITAWFFHMRTNEAAGTSGRHIETDPSHGSGPIEALPKLGGIDGTMLRELRESVLGSTSGPAGADADWRRS